MSEELILTEIEENKEEYVNFFRDLISAESYNPPGNEKNVALKIESYLKDIDIKCELFPFGNNRANLLAYLNDNFDQKNLLYNGHMDVVPPGNEEEWKYPPLSATIKGTKTRSRIYGRGSVDMKGGLAAMIISLKILKKLDLKLSGNLIINAVADEETGGKFGTEWCLENHLKSINCNLIIIGEMTGMEPLGNSIVVGEKGHLHIKIITKGILGHSMMPSMSKNPINMMSEIIINLDKMDKYMPKIEPPISYDKYKVIFSKLFPNNELFERILNEQKALQVLFDAMTQFTKSFTIINAGVKNNVIPDRCEAIIDFRLLPGQSIEMIINALEKMIKNELGYEIKKELTGDPEEFFVHIEADQYSESSYWEGWEKSQKLKSFANTIRQVYGQEPVYILSPGGTDASYYRNTNYCPQTIVFGPGDATLGHTINESIKIQDFINAIKVYTLFAYNFLK
ncbi:MAG: M20 family metallopeptidase [Candidatus Thorarchaeota archaeon]